MILLSQFHEAIKNLFLGRKTADKIHNIKDRYTATTLREQTRSVNMNKKIKQSTLYKIGGLDTIEDIDVILRGGAAS